MKANFFFLMAMAGMVDSIKDFGKKRANPYACPTNNLKLSGNCECDDKATACEDTIEIEADETALFTGVMFAGTMFDVNTPILNLDGAELQGAVGPIPVLETHRIEDWICAVVNTHEIDLSVDVSYADDVLTIKHIGCVALNSAMVDGTETEAKRCCELEVVTKWAAQGVDEIADFGFNGATESLANNPYEYEGVTATDEATAAELQADITTALTALGVGLVGEVTVKVNDVSGAFDISFYTSDDEAVLIGTSPVQDCGKKEMFNCPEEDGEEEIEVTP